MECQANSTSKRLNDVKTWFELLKILTQPGRGKRGPHVSIISSFFILEQKKRESIVKFLCSKKKKRQKSFVLSRVCEPIEIISVGGKKEEIMLGFCLNYKCFGRPNDDGHQVDWWEKRNCMDWKRFALETHHNTTQNGQRKKCHVQYKWISDLSGAARQISDAKSLTRIF